VVVSWGSSCPSIQKNANFVGPGTYEIWIGVKNLTAADVNVGSDVTLFYGPGVPDAWRFDDPGCQSASHVQAISKGNSRSCPPLLGQSPLFISFLWYDSSAQRAGIRLSTGGYSAFTPAPGITYTLWNLFFDHTQSVVGADGDPATCDHVEQPLCFYFPDPADDNYPMYLWTSDFSREPLTPSPQDGMITWNGGCQPVAAKASTWARIKATYR
jgi:hypothetical protein